MKSERNRAPTNKYDHFAVAVLKDGEGVGHVPRAISKVTLFFLGYDGNVVFCEVTGERLNHEVDAFITFMAVVLM